MTTTSHLFACFFFRREKVQKGLKKITKILQQQKCQLFWQNYSVEIRILLPKNNFRAVFVILKGAHP